MQSELPPLLTKRQARAFLQISPSALDRRIANGRISTIKLGDGKSSPVRIPRDALLDYAGLGESAPTRRNRRQAAAEEQRMAALFGDGME